uniref:GRF-type domain-containing protein n=1 Tax=Solanum tuberosum TaxID=4113 RepID=M1DGX7_SOLTU
MSNAMLHRICNDENDPMLRVKLRCKHGGLLSMQTSWWEHNPARRFWSCPRYREDACNFFRWKDCEDVDIRSKYVILRLAKRIKELEEVLAS